VRAFFLVLLAVNVAFFAWAHYVSPPEAAADPSPLARQIEPAKLKIVSAKDLPPPAPAKAAAAPVPAPAPVATKCMEWGSFTVADAPQAEKRLEPLGTRVAQRHTEETAAWWVFIPPQPNRNAAIRKAAELKGLGIEDYFVVQEAGANRWALSLGVFRAEEAAKARLAALRKQGVRSAQVGPRETIVPKIWLQVKNVDAALEAKLKDVVQEIEGSELRICP